MRGNVEKTYSLGSKCSTVRGYAENIGKYRATL